MIIVVVDIFAPGRAAELLADYIILQGLGGSAYFAESLDYGYVHGRLPHDVLWKYTQHMLSQGVSFIPS